VRVPRRHAVRRGCARSSARPANAASCPPAARPRDRSGGGAPSPRADSAESCSARGSTRRKRARGTWAPAGPARKARVAKSRARRCAPSPVANRRSSAWCVLRSAWAGFGNGESETGRSRTQSTQYMGLNPGSTPKRASSSSSFATLLSIASLSMSGWMMRPFSLKRPPVFRA
jgi:hypothetical protein